MGKRKLSVALSARGKTSHNCVLLSQTLQYILDRFNVSFSSEDVHWMVDSMFTARVINRNKCYR